MLGSRKPGTDGFVMAMVMWVAAVIAVIALFSGTVRWIVLAALVLVNIVAMPARIRRGRQDLDHQSRGKRA